MKIYLNKFGTLLISRQAGKEALAAIQPQLKTIGKDENLEIDFGGVTTFSPSWGDEFLSPMFKNFQDRLVLKNTQNSSVVATLDLLEKISSRSFRRE